MHYEQGGKVQGYIKAQLNYDMTYKTYSINGCRAMRDRTIGLIFLVLIAIHQHHRHRRRCYGKVLATGATLWSISGTWAG
mgnify:CR=1 FL=1